MSRGGGSSLGRSWFAGVHLLGRSGSRGSVCFGGHVGRGSGGVALGRWCTRSDNLVVGAARLRSLRAGAWERQGLVAGRRGGGGLAARHQPDGVDVPVHIGRRGLPTTLRWHLADVPCVSPQRTSTGKAGRP